MLDRRHLIEILERRRMLANWSPAAQLVEQDDAATSFPTITGQGVTVAVIDTGVDYTHANLGGGFGPGKKVKAGFDFADNDADPMDTDGHGTKVAGVIAAEGFTSGGIFYQGVAPDVELVALRIAHGNEGVADATIEKAVKWVETNYATYGISIVNISFGYSAYDAPFDNPTLSDDFAKLEELGILVVASSGNAGGANGVSYPAADANVLAIGAVDTAGGISNFTQRGETLDMLAPGEGVGTVTMGGGFSSVSGTSFASPMVAGTAALMKQVDPSLKDADMLSILRASGIRKDDGSTFYPRIDIYNAVALAMKRTPEIPTNIGLGGTTSDLAYDKQGILHVAYYDPDLHTIKYASRNTSGDWSEAITIDTTGHDVGAYLSLATDALDKPALAYYDATTADLVYAQFDGRNWTRQRLDSSKTVGQFASLAFKANGDAVVAYYRKTSGDLRAMSFDAVAGTWARTYVDTAGDVGRFASVAVSPNGTIGVGYVDVTNGDVKYAQLSGTTWTPATVDDLAGVAYVSLAFDEANAPAVSYYDAFPADLKFATHSSGAWVATTIGKTGAQGLYTNLWFDSENRANVVYYNRKADALFRLRGGVGTFTADTLGLGGGQLASASPNSDGTIASYAWWNAKKNRLVIGDVV